MVRSTTLLFIALSISAVFGASERHAFPTSTDRRLSRRHASKAKAKLHTRTTAVKSKRCPAKPSGSSNSTASSTGSSSSGSGDDSDSGSGDDDNDNDESSGSGSGSSSNSTSSSSSSSDNNGGNVSGVLPSGNIIAGWTTVQNPPAGLNNVKTYTLSDDTFVIKNGISALAHPIESFDGEPAMHIHYNQGSYELKTSPTNIQGGFSFYTTGPSQSGSSSTPEIDLDGLKAKEVSFGYAAQFSKGFQFNKGGKMPGTFGGDNWNDAITASGGNHNANAFSTRMMFRPNGQGQLYLYLPPDLNRANLCGATGISECDGPDAGNGKTYGATVGTGLFNWENTGVWTQMRQVIHLNDQGQQNGWAEVYINGDSTPKIKIENISFGDGVFFWGCQMQSFFGGHDTTWASPQDQDLYLKDFSIAVTETF